MTGFRLRFALFLGLIVGPAGVLTFLSLRAALDEQGSVLADLRLRVPGLTTAFHERLGSILERLPVDGGEAVEAADMPEVELLFDLDDRGEFVRPAVLRARLVERHGPFAERLRRGETHELGAGDLPLAATAYRDALEHADTPGERAEALNALGRVYLAAGDLDGAEDTHRQLQSHAATLDADGAHPLTLSSLRRSRHLAEDSDSAGPAVVLIESWSGAVLTGDIPLHPGVRLAADELRRLLKSGRWQPGRPDLLVDLDRIDLQAGFVAAYDRLLETAVVRPEATYLCGLGQAGRTYFAVMRPDTAGARGALVDLEALTEVLLDTPNGEMLRADGFDIALFDADDTAEFERRYDADMRLVAPISPAIYRLNVGIFSRDEPFVFEHHRNRGALLVGGIAFLAGAIGLGVWVLMRETAREVETARLRSEFVANVSHELRTPLTSIRMYAETLLLGRLRTEEQRHEYLQTVMRESQRLSRMVGNILTFSRLESGRKTFDFAATDVGEVVRATLEEFEPVLTEGGFAVEIDIAADLPQVDADAEALETSVANLVSNAVKYSPGERQVRVRVSRANDQVVIEVADRGVGIPAGEARSVFGKYRRASNASDIATGTGLGLALVEGIARAHRGSVVALPRDGGGTVIRLTLPVTRS